MTTLEARCQTLIADGRIDEAEPDLAAAVESTSAPPILRFYHALALFTLARLDDALGALNQLLAEHQALPAIALKADILITQGRYHDAEALLAPHLDSHAVPVVTNYARLAPHVGKTQRAITLLTTLDQRDLPPEHRAEVLSRLALLLDREGRYDEAFATAVRANSQSPTTFDPSTFERTIDAAIRSPPVLTGEVSLESATMTEGVPGSRPSPIYILGVPRSGTSLVESILAAHPHVTALGETRAAEQICNGGAGVSPAGDLGDDILYAYRALASTPAVTDKRLSLFTHIHTLASAIPDARFIWVRRDARDACLSCYLHNFRTGADFTRDLTHLAAFANGYARLMHHWCEHHSIHILDYETLVADPEPTIRALLDAVDLPFNDACLRPHQTDRATLTESTDQVRAPLNAAAVGRWRRYERCLQPLIDHLDAHTMPA